MYYTLFGLKGKIKLNLKMARTYIKKLYHLTHRSINKLINT